MRGNISSVRFRLTVALFAVALLVTGTRTVAQENVLYNFGANGTDGIFPYASLIFDAHGNLYGTTYNGGISGDGTVFELTPKAGGGWTEKVLHSFNNNGKDGIDPQANLIFDVHGNLYGTTPNGGANGFGTVFELTPKAGGGWTEKVVHSFKFNGTDGMDPIAGLTVDAKGDLYGTTSEGGVFGAGTLFELTPKEGGGWGETLLHKFNGKDGISPQANLIFDAHGNLYGTTLIGGDLAECDGSGCGTVFELLPKAGGGWTQQVLHSFINNGKDGINPQAGLILDTHGNLYGTTSAAGAFGFGAVFELTPKAGGVWTEKILHSFNNNGTDGTYPQAGLILDATGNLYGTTVNGGDLADCNSSGCGTAFELIPKAGGGWTEKILHSFNNNGTDGTYPQAGLILDTTGNLYGTTYQGGTNNDGTVFEITP